MSDFEAPLLQLLSDRGGRLAGLRLHPHGVDAAGIDALAADTALADLAAQLPCLVELPGEPALSAALQALGLRALIPAELAATTARPGPTLPATARWLPGDWYLQPPEAGSHAQSASRAMALKLMQLVAAEADTRELEEIFRREPILSYHLLRLVNSVAMGLSRKITSFSQAIVLIGRQQLRRWLNFILFAARDDDPRSAMLLARVAARARWLELLARSAGRDRAQQDAAFMAGMFSLLGALFGQPLAEVLQPLKLGEELLAAVLERRGWLGELLALVEAAEQGDTARLDAGLAAAGLTPAAFAAAGIDAHRWMLDVVRESEGSGHG